MRQAWGGVKNTAGEPDIPWFKAGRIPKGWITLGGRVFTSLNTDTAPGVVMTSAGMISQQP